MRLKFNRLPDDKEVELELPDEMVEAELTRFELSGLMHVSCALCDEARSLGGDRGSTKGVFERKCKYCRVQEIAERPHACACLDTFPGLRAIGEPCESGPGLVQLMDDFAQWIRQAIERGERDETQVQTTA